MRPIKREEGDVREHEDEPVGEDEHVREAERELWAGIEALGAARGERGGERSDAELIARVMDQVQSGRDRDAREDDARIPAPNRGRLRGGVVAAFVAVSAAAALAVASGELGDVGEPDDTPVVAEAPPELPAAPATVGAPAPVPPAAAPPITAGDAPGPASLEASPVPIHAPAIGTGTRSPSTPPRALDEPATADELLRRAQGLLKAGRTTEAIGAYRDLVARRPGSGEARTALVSLGQISLDEGRAEEALGYLDQYVAAGGPLHEEASYLRIDALRRLGRAAEASTAVGEFLGRYPESVHAERLRAVASPPAHLGDAPPARPVTGGPSPSP